QDWAKIQVKSAEPRPSQIPPSKLRIGVPDCGSSSTSGNEILSSGEYSPDSSIAMVSMSLKVEPGSVRSAVGRFSYGRTPESTISSMFSEACDVECTASKFVS